MLQAEAKSNGNAAKLLEKPCINACASEAVTDCNTLK
jgi:hypothetical protein